VAVIIEVTKDAEIPKRRKAKKEHGPKGQEEACLDDQIEIDPTKPIPPNQLLQMHPPSPPPSQMSSQHPPKMDGLV
jgi:hypothetical protein